MWPFEPGGEPMNRRRFVRAGAAGAALAAAGADARAAGAQAPAAREHYELRSYELRNDIDPAHTSAFFERHLVPALRRAGAGPVGCFSPESGLPQPSLLMVVPYPSLAAVGAVGDRLAADAALRAAEQGWERAGRLPYVRYDTALYRAFAGHPRLAAGPAAAPGAGARLFELRTYEAPNDTGLRAKVQMFDQEEIRIFREVGFSNVWFGQAVAAPRMPLLTYMVAFDDAAARAKAWSAFGSHPDWQRIRVRPGWTDPETVSSIRAAFLRPTGFSQVR
jgi:hypothetical protein